MEYRTLRNILRNDAGATAMEYSLVVAVITVTLLAAMTGVSDTVNELFVQVANAVNGAGR